MAYLDSGKKAGYSQVGEDKVYRGYVFGEDIRHERGQESWEEEGDRHGGL